MQIFRHSLGRAGTLLLSGTLLASAYSCTARHTPKPTHPEAQVNDDSRAVSEPDAKPQLPPLGGTPSGALSGETAEESIANRELRLRESHVELHTEFWLFAKNGPRLRFESPWETDHPSIATEATDDRVAPWALSCAEQSRKNLEALLNQGATQNLWQALGKAGVSRDVLLIVDQLPESKFAGQLTRFDRTPDVWFWNFDNKRPQLAFARWRDGRLVYEVTATPESCMGPTAEQGLDFLTYAELRLRRSPQGA